MRSDSCHIRETTESDVMQLAELVDSICRERRFLAATVGFGVDSTLAFMRGVRAAGGVHVVAIGESGLVGWCDITPQPFEGMKHVGRLGMGVHRECRSLGVGRMLVEAAFERAFAADIERIELEVLASNKVAIRLYEGLGFVAEGRKKDARKLDGITDDLLLYAKHKRS